MDGDGGSLVLLLLLFMTTMMVTCAWLQDVGCVYVQRCMY